MLIFQTIPVLPSQQVLPIASVVAVVRDGLRKPQVLPIPSVVTVIRDGLRKPRLHSLGLQPLPLPQVMALVARTGVIKITTTVFNVRDKFLG